MAAGVFRQRTRRRPGWAMRWKNWLIVSRLFPEAFRQLRVQHLASSYRQLLATCRSAQPAHPRQSAPRMVLLTPARITKPSI